MDAHRQVVAARTTLTPTEALDAIWHGHQAVIGGPCPVNLLALLTAQSALETGRWKSMWNFNMGNIRGPGQGGEWMAIPGANEVIDGMVVSGPAVEGGFAAFRDRYEGAKAFVRFLGTASHPPNANRYQPAWDAAAEGDVVGYVSGLKAAGYFTADEGLYLKGVAGTLDWLRSDPLPKFLAYLSAEPVTLGA